MKFLLLEAEKSDVLDAINKALAQEDYNTARNLFYNWIEQVVGNVKIDDLIKSILFDEVRESGFIPKDVKLSKSLPLLHWFIKYTTMQREVPQQELVQVIKSLADDKRDATTLSLISNDDSLLYKEVLKKRPNESDKDHLFRYKTYIYLSNNSNVEKWFDENPIGDSAEAFFNQDAQTIKEILADKQTKSGTLESTLSNWLEKNNIKDAKSFMKSVNSLNDKHLRYSLENLKNLEKRIEYIYNKQRSSLDRVDISDNASMKDVCKQIFRIRLNDKELDEETREQFEQSDIKRYNDQSEPTQNLVDTMIALLDKDIKTIRKASPIRFVWEQYNTPQLKKELITNLLAQINPTVFNDLKSTYNLVKTIFYRFAREQGAKANG